MFEQTINIDRMEQAVALFGTFDENIKIIQNEYLVSVTVRGSELKISGDVENVSKAVSVINSLLTLINHGEALSEQNVRYCMSLVNEGSDQKIESLSGDCICITSKGKPVKPKTIGQKNYCSAIKQNTITIGVGPAGTGKTYLAVAMAVTSFRAHEVNKIILQDLLLRRAKSLDFFQVICRVRLTRICVRFMTHFSICLVRKPIKNTSKEEISRLLRSHI